MTSSITRRVVVATTAALAGIAALPARGQNAMPRGPIRILVGFSPGGSADVVARLIAEKLRERTGVQTIVENKPGAGGVIATEAVVKMPPDGNVVVLAAMASTVMAKLTYVKLPYDPLVDLAPVSLVSTFQLALAIDPKLPVKTMPEFVAWAKANPKLANFGIPAPGGHSHFFGLMLGKALGIDMQPVPYKGSAPMITDIGASQLHVGVSALSDFMGAWKGGKVRVLATSGTARSLAATELPTFAESGYPALVGEGWLGLYGPAATPPAAAAALAAEVTEILAIPDIRDRIVAMGMEPRGGTPAELADFDRAELKRWAPVVEASGFKVQ